MQRDTPVMPQAAGALFFRWREGPGARAVPLTRAATVVASVIVVLMAVAGAAHAQQPGPLSPARYAALDSLYTTLVALEEGSTPTAVADTRRLCQGLDRGDRLLAIFGSTCLTALKIASASDGLVACETRGQCERATRRVRMRITELIVKLRASNRIVAREVQPGPCRTELTASRSLLRQTTKLRDGLKLMERGIRTGSIAVIDRAETQITDAGAQLARQPTTREARETFRRVCAPAAPPAPPPATPS